MLHWLEKTEGKDSKISALDLLERYSPEFSDFLCKCLKFNYKDRENIKNLVGKNGHPWLNPQAGLPNKTKIQITIGELLKVSGGWMEDKKVSSLYLNEFKRNQVEKLLDFIECVEHTPATISKSKIKQVAEELGIDEEYLNNKLKELDNYK